MKAIGLLSVLAFLAAVTSGVEIQCDFLMSYWEGIGSFYSCDATVVAVENSKTVTDISGTHAEGKSNEDVAAFYAFGEESVAKIPNGIENFFPDLEVFYWFNGNISSVDSSTFEPFPNLLVIQLGGNKLVALDGNLFQHTRKLQSIVFQNNELEQVGHELLTGLTDLTWADFRSNPCIDAYANTTQQFEELNLQLPIQCPPLATTPDPPTTTISSTSEPNECPDTCTINDEAQEMRIRIEEIERRLSELE